MSVIPKPDSNRLIETYRSYAHAIAAEVLRKLPNWVDKDDVVGAAEMGLVEAAQNYDPERGVLFKTFAYYRIRGAIFDDLRKNGWLKQMPSLRFEDAANEYLKDQASAAEPGGAEAERAEIEQLTTSVLTCYLLSLSAMTSEPLDRQEHSPEEQFLSREAAERVRAALDQLPEKNRQVLHDYYYKDRNMLEIGQSMGWSKSWVCRLHARSLEMMREILERRECAAPATP